MNKIRFEKEVMSVLDRTKRVWGPHHKNSTEALRWWFAYTEAEGMVETFNMREWAETILDGLLPVPNTIKEVIDVLWDRLDVDEEEDQISLQRLETFYTEED